MGKFRIALILLFISAIWAGIAAQHASIFDQLEHSPTPQVKVRVIQNDSIQKVVEEHQWQLSRAKGIMGYRIRIFSDSGPEAKKKFEFAKANFSENFGGTPIHQEFVYPFYKIYVGDFRNRSEALFVLKQIEWKFPDAFIVQTRINYPNLKKE